MVRRTVVVRMDARSVPHILLNSKSVAGQTIQMKQRQLSWSLLVSILHSAFAQKKRTSQTRMVMNEDVKYLQMRKGLGP